MLAAIMERVSHGHIIRRAVHGKFGPHSDVLASGWTFRISIKRWGHPRADRKIAKCRRAVVKHREIRHGTARHEINIKARCVKSETICTSSLDDVKQRAHSTRYFLIRSFTRRRGVFITLLVISRAEILRRKGLIEWDRHIEGNAVFIIGHYQLLLLGNVPFLFTRRFVCLLNDLITLKWSYYRKMPIM